MSTVLGDRKRPSRRAVAAAAAVRNVFDGWVGTAGGEGGCAICIVVRLGVANAMQILPVSRDAAKENVSIRS